MKYLLVAIGIVFALPAVAYPDRPITFIVPFAAGGDADLAGRNLAAAAQGLLKQPVVVINKAGASGSIGSQQVENESTDGYTLLVARVGSNAVLPALQKNLSYKWNDFTFIGLLELNPVVCVVHPARNSTRSPTRCPQAPLPFRRFSTKPLKCDGSGSCRSFCLTRTRFNSAAEFSRATPVVALCALMPTASTCRRVAIVLL